MDIRPAVYRYRPTPAAHTSPLGERRQTADGGGLARPGSRPAGGVRAAGAAAPGSDRELVHLQKADEFARHATDASRCHHLINTTIGLDEKFVLS